jgi:hypothetical protein
MLVQKTQFEDVGRLPVKNFPNTRSSGAVNFFGVVVVLIVSFVGSISSCWAEAWSA